VADTTHQVTRNMLADKCPDDPFDYFIGATNERVAAYSTDIAAAWLVVEKLLPTHDLMLESVSGNAYARFSGALYSGTAVATTAPLAICHSALMAVNDPFGESVVGDTGDATKP
jgi:hypothetical protein